MNLRSPCCLAGALVLLMAAIVPALAAAAADGCDQAVLAYVGGEDGEVRALRLDACAGRLEALEPRVVVAKPRWLLVHPERPLLYVASEGRTKEGSIAAFALDRASGALEPFGEAPSGGAGTTHLWLDPPSATLLTANFGAGSAASLALGSDGRVGEVVSVIAASGSGPHPRQAGPHAHGVALDPARRFALVADMGADRVFVYAFDAATGALRPDDTAAPRSLAVPAGSGPRHFVFDASGRFVYLLNELTAKIMVLRWDAERGRLTPVQTLAMASEGFAGQPSGAEIARSSDGRFLYAANRGEHALLAFRIDPANGELGLVQRIRSGGEKPWTFAIDPSGRWVLVANYGSHRVSLFRIDQRAGTLMDTGESVEVRAPLSLAFVP